jgi:hypothetical protein
MATLELEDVSPADWIRAAESLPEFNMMQSWSYGAAKQATGPWQPERGLFRNQAGDVIGVVQTLVRSLPGPVRGGLAWINRGPLCEPADLPSVLMSLQDHYTRGRKFYTRIALPVPPGSLGPDVLVEAGLARTDTPGWASMRVDLRLPDAEIRGNLDQKWRNALNRAQKSGLMVSVGSDSSVSERFLDQYALFLAKRAFDTTVQPPLLRALNDALPEERKLVCFLAEHQGAVVAGALIARSGMTAEYLVGFTHEAARGLNAGQLLLWHALCHARDTGCVNFDLGGADPHLTPPGILHFKAGLGGHAYRYENEVESIGGGVMARLVRWRATAARRAN